MMKIFFTLFFGFIFMVNNLMLMFSVSLSCLIIYLMFMFYSMSNGDYMIMISLYMGMDKYSFYMIMLSVWIISLMYLSLFFDEFSEIKLKIMVFNVIMIVLMLFFSFMNLLMMYLFFEISLIPTFFIVFYWGNNLERLSASFYLLMYMMFISLPLLVYIFKLYFYNFNLSMNLMILDWLNLYKLGEWDFLIMFGAFFIKLPIYLFHIWLPKAHVEAPVYGSMLLAAILLKLGGYGLIRLSMMFMWECFNYSFFLISLGIVGSMYVSFYCLVQVDMKMMVAYSSVVHMNFMMSTLFSLLKMGTLSSIIVMISHGLCSSGLFYMVNMYYLRSYSRLIIMNKGYINYMPTVMIWWFLLCSSNFSFPLSLNFIGEIMMIMVLLSWSFILFLMVMVICFFSGAYSLYLYSIINHGEINNMIKGGNDYGYVLEHMTLMLHYLPLFLLMLNLYVCM